MQARIILAVLSLLILCAVPAFSATIHVPADQPTIQAGINVALDGDLVLVAPGTYLENIEIGGRQITVEGEQGADVTVIDGNQTGSVVRFMDSSGDSILDGFTVTNGNENGGGGIFCYDSSPTIMNCTISGNIAHNNDGGGIYCNYSSPTIMNCIIWGNVAVGSGGGIYCNYSSPTITNCTISENRTNAYGGGAISCHSSSSPTITNCTITNNTAYSSGGGISCGGSLTVLNSILWGNYAPDDPEIHGGTPEITYSDIEGGFTGTGNINLNPLFWGGGYYRLTEGSPCIDAGNPSVVYNDVCILPSLGAERNDMGAYGGPQACSWCRDNDGDGYYEGAACGDDDCDDSNPLVHPEADELCNGRDDDCNGEIPENENDWDGDDWEIYAGDCDDTDPLINPVMPEICDDDIDNDCDDLVDWADTECDCWDSDGDGFDDPACDGLDCDDEDPDSYPGADETCDGMDNDCDGDPGADEVDADADSFMICDGDCDDWNPNICPDNILCPDKTEDGIDQNCDGIDGIPGPCFVLSAYTQ